MASSEMRRPAVDVLGVTVVLWQLSITHIDDHLGSYICNSHNVYWQKQSADDQAIDSRSGQA